MMWFTYDDDHRDFECDQMDSGQKLKGDVTFSLDSDGPPKVDLEMTMKKKEGFVYKIKEKVLNVKGKSRKLF